MRVRVRLELRLRCLMQPTKIEIKNDTLIMDWDNDEHTQIALRELRKNCPCVYCNSYREHHSESRLQVFLEEQIKISEINIVGSYALSIKWKDGHHTGIFEFSQLKELAT